jgi:photosystem II stability/assembly factor-like uncharacterized protein
MHMLFRSRGRAWTAAAFTAALTLIAGASAGVNTPQSGWYSGNPVLGPNDLSDLVCSGTTCYASGSFGTLLKSTDAGSSWSGVVTGLTIPLARVRLAGSSDRVIVGGGCSLRRSDNGGQTFQRLPFSASDASCPSAVVAFSFPSSDVGYLVLANKSFLSTADGGRTFTRRTAVPPVPAPTDLLCTSVTTCFATAGGSIQRTADGGVTWTEVAQFGLQLFGLEHADVSTLYAVGQAQQVLKSSDGGATWARKPVSGVPPSDFASIRCVGLDTCLIATRTRDRVVRTTDGGETFSSVVTPTQAAQAVELASPTRGLAVGLVGSAVVSDDTGETWRVVGGRLDNSFNALEAATETVAYAGGADGALARTVDAGQTWANVSPPTPLTIRAIAAPTATRLFVLAMDGTLQRSDNGGASYRLLNTGAPSSPADVVATDAQHVLLVGTRGVRRSIDGGETFSAVSDRDLRNARLVAAETAGSAMFAHGAKRLLYSPNGGLSWRRVRLPRGISVFDISFVSAQVGHAVDRGGRLWRTTNGGRSWTQLVTVGRSVHGVDFADSRNGYARVGGLGRLSYGFVMRTSDGGASWRPQLVSASPVNAVEAEGGTAYVWAGNSLLYATRSGGDVGASRTLRITTRGRRLSKPGPITVSGRLSAATAGERVVVSMLTGERWIVQEATVASNGTFVTRWRVTRKCLFIAHVLGSADSAGAGTKPLRVLVRKAPKKR